MRRLIAIGAAVGVAGASLVAMPVAQAGVVNPEPQVTVQKGIPFDSPTQVSLQWTLDSDSDDTATVTNNPSGGSGCESLAANDDSCIITGLNPGTSYTFTVSVTDGNDDTSATVAATPATVPASPVITSIAAGSERAWIDWTAPATGGSPITGYTVSTNPVGGSCSPGTATECILTGLTDNSTYSVTVTATNDMGTSLPSTTAVRPSSTSGLPSEPTAVSAIATGSTSAEVSFTPATTVTGFPTKDYSATCTSSNGGVTADDTAASSPITVTGLTVDRTYTCTVKARNDNGESPASLASNGFTPNSADILGAPTIGTAIGGSLQATVSWTAPNPATGLTTYQVAYLLNGVWSSPITTGSTSTTYTLTSLTPGSYSFRVRAVTVGGAGPWSDQSSPAVTVTAGTIGVPSAPEGSPDNSQVSLAWTTPTSGTLSPTSYQVRYSADGGVSWTELTPTDSSTTTADILGLANGTSYIFGVRAINGGTVGQWSENSAAITPGPPGVPTEVRGTVSDRSVVLTWVAPEGPPTPSEYEVQFSIDDQSTWLPAEPLTATSTSRTIAELTNGVAYVFRVRALNGTLTGEWSLTSAAVTPQPSVTPTIRISGMRGNDNERSRRIFVDGTTTGLPVGTVLAPFIHLPGQIGMTIGTARREIDANEEFSWTRRAGKKIRVRFATPQDEYRSNVVIIRARQR